MKTYIFDRNAGFLQWSSDKIDALEALQEFDEAVGIDPHGEGINRDDWFIVLADADLSAKIEQWAQDGFPAATAPLEVWPHY